MGGATLFFGFSFLTLIFLRNFSKCAVLCLMNDLSAPSSSRTAKSSLLSMTFSISDKNDSSNCPTSHIHCARANITLNLSSSYISKSRSFFISSGSSPRLYLSKNSSFISRDVSLPKMLALHVPIGFSLHTFVLIQLIT